MNKIAKLKIYQIRNGLNKLLTLNQKKCLMRKLFSSFNKNNLYNYLLTMISLYFKL